mgnify:CR=1 FL=1
MIVRRLFIIVAALMLLVQAPARSQQMFPPGTFAIGGIPVVCGTVPTVIVAGPGDMGRATPATPFQPATIWLDAAFHYMPLEVQFFIYGHECAHHQPNVGSNESLADCWAAQVGKRQGWFTAISMQYLTMQFAWNPGDWTHAPGPVRLSNISACYNSA